MRFSEGGSQSYSLRMLPDFGLFASDERVRVKPSLQRVLAYLALAGGLVERSRVAGELWPEVTEKRALGNLRSVLWRADKAPRSLIETAERRLRISAQLTVDMRRVSTACESMMTGGQVPELVDLQLIISASDLLPSWDEEWLMAERERFRELRLAALEAAGTSLIGSAQPGLALVALGAATRSEPYRDTARRLLIEAHLRRGNYAEALREFDRYRRLLRDDLGIAPSAETLSMIATARRKPHRAIRLVRVREGHRTPA